MAKPVKLTDAKIQAWLDYLDEAVSSCTTSINTLDVAIAALTLRVTALENKPAPTPASSGDMTALSKQVSANSAALLQARTDLDRFLKDASESIDSIDLIAGLVKPLIEGDRTSAIEKVRQWPHK